MYHFISGYTAKVAGTEMGVTRAGGDVLGLLRRGVPRLASQPATPSCSPRSCVKHGAKAWLVNTGWTGGPYGTGRRMSLPHTRAIIDAIHSGALDGELSPPDPIFRLSVPKRVPGCPDEILRPDLAWGDASAYERTARQLVEKFERNYASFLQQEAGGA